MQGLEELEPAGVPAAMLDIYILLLGIFMCLAGILIAGAAGGREVRLALPEVDKGVAAERQAGGDGVEIVLTRDGGIAVNGRALGAMRELERQVTPGQPVRIIIEKGAAADALIAAEAHLRKIGTTSVTVLVKEAAI